jgi:hypothetical protein
MDELDLFRDFRSGVPAPSAEAEWQASARLKHAIESRDGLGTRVLRLIRRRPARTALAFLTVGTATAAILVGTPWQSSPGFLERAEAALTPPAGSILHYRWETQIPTDAGCATGRNEIWIDQTPPHAYRALLADCAGRSSEVGGALDTDETLMFVPPDTLSVPDQKIDLVPDPVQGLREAIRDGRAHHEGKTQLDWRTVERIRLECSPDPPCSGRPSYAYVDPETFFPVQTEIPGGFGAAGGQRFDLVLRFPTYEYLPRTAANLALTDIRAQHPDATGP